MSLIKLGLYFLIALRWIKNLIIVLLLISFVAQFITNIERYPALNKLNNGVKKTVYPVKNEMIKLIPYRYKNVDFSSLILAVILQIIASQIFVIEEKLRRKKYSNKKNSPVEIPDSIKMKIEGINSGENEKVTAWEGLSIQQPSDRKKILKQFATLKSKLDEMGQQLAFLSIDVVDSTGMKQDEDKYIVALAFERYNELVNESLQEHGVVKFAMTPDGIMSCFRTVDDAVSTASSLFKKLEKFNKEDKMIKRDFQIRCGINTGFVYLDDETPLEQVSDRIIDIAGHMQKYAKPNTINIAASAIEPLKNSQGFNETTDVIDGQKVYQWKK
ncbi:conserved protein of unknown function [Legionella hackeliae]|uniref:Uncharacterized protein n=2 Tax=Legionella hackeliae TaxID=449 RepID=A0A0A8US75_LEGHA|nr:hypothetical protein Lhac_0488 [Legionella hackeliae]CEK10386.1 conserved protein of unknown function [Legionella hackeliae]